MSGDWWPGYFNVYGMEVTPEIENLIQRISQLNHESSEATWLECLDSMEEDYDSYISNSDEEGDSRLFPSQRWTFQHHAAYHNAPVRVLEEIRENKFALSLKDAEGKLPIDHVNTDMPDSYKSLLKPKFKFELDVEKVNKIEKMFHALILHRVEELIKKNNVILPVISVLLEEHQEHVQKVHFEVPGYLGGFNYHLELNADKNDVEALISHSFSRVIGGSGQIHRCTESKYILVADNTM